MSNLHLLHIPAAAVTLLRNPPSPTIAQWNELANHFALEEDEHHDFIERVANALSLMNQVLVGLHVPMVGIFTDSVGTKFVVCGCQQFRGGELHETYENFLKLHVYLDTIGWEAPDTIPAPYVAKTNATQFSAVDREQLMAAAALSAGVVAIARELRALNVNLSAARAPDIQLNLEAVDGIEVPTVDDLVNSKGAPAPDEDGPEFSIGDVVVATVDDPFFDRGVVVGFKEGYLPIVSKFNSSSVLTIDHMDRIRVADCFPHSPFGLVLSKAIVPPTASLAEWECGRLDGWYTLPSGILDGWASGNELSRPGAWLMPLVHLRRKLDRTFSITVDPNATETLGLPTY